VIWQDTATKCQLCGATNYTTLAVCVESDGTSSWAKLVHELASISKLKDPMDREKLEIMYWTMKGKDRVTQVHDEAQIVDA
jgi:hypothetical protein